MKKRTEKAKRRKERETLHICNMAGAAGKRTKRESKAEAEAIIAYDSDVDDFYSLAECSFVQVSLYNFSPGQSSRAELSMWYLDDDAQKFGTRIAKKSWPVGSLQPAKTIIAYDSDMFSEELGWLHQCARVQVTLYDFSPGESARISIKCRMMPEQFEDESDPVQNSAKSAEARAALRAAQRAGTCVDCTKLMLPDETKCRASAFKDFKRQLDEMDKDAKVKTEEYDDVIQTMKLLEAHHKKEAFGE
jgi:hypothetical protein